MNQLVNMRFILLNYYAELNSVYIRLFLWLLFAFTIVPAKAQILNIEKSKVQRDTSNFFTGSFNLSGSFYNRSAAADKPVNLLGINFKADLLYLSNQHAYIFINKFDYLRINENPFINTGFSHFRIHFYRDKRYSFELFTQYQYDNFRQLNPRIIVGGAPRFKFIDSDNLLLYGATGLMWEYEQWVHPINEQIVDISLLKSTSYMSLRSKISESFDFNVVNYYQVGYDPEISALRHRVNLMTNVIAKITQKLSFTFSFNIQYEDKPIVPINKVIYDIRNGVMYTF